MDGRYITEARTAAVSAVSVKHLALPDARVLAIIGSGVQARSHLEAIRHVRTLADVRVWSPSPTHREAFAAEMSTPQLPVSVAADGGRRGPRRRHHRPGDGLADAGDRERRRELRRAHRRGRRVPRRSTRDADGPRRAGARIRRFTGRRVERGRRPAAADRRGRDRGVAHLRRAGRRRPRDRSAGGNGRRTSRSSSRLAWPSRTSSLRASCSSGRAKPGSASDSASYEAPTCCDPPSPRWSPWRRSRHGPPVSSVRKAGSTPRPPAPSTRPAVPRTTSTTPRRSPSPVAR